MFANPYREWLSTCAGAGITQTPGPPGPGASGPRADDVSIAGTPPASVGCAVAAPVAPARAGEPSRDAAAPPPDDDGARLTAAARVFQPWRPEAGCVFGSAYALDTETTPIDPAQPWQVPECVLVAVFDGHTGYFLEPSDVPAFLAVHANVPVVMHHAPFDLGVIHRIAPALDIYGWIDRDLAWDTRLLHRLYVLATEGHTAHGAGESTLEHCAASYLRLDLPKDTTDFQGNPVRTSYARWLGRPIAEIEPVYLEYLAKDAIVTRWLFSRVWQLLKERLEASAAEFGFVSSQWLYEQFFRWGPQTHHIQLRGAIVLEAVSANGLRVNVDRCRRLLADLQAERERALVDLKNHGWSPGQGSEKQLQRILSGIAARHPGVVLPRTSTGRYGTSAKKLAGLGLNEPFLEVFRRHSASTKQIEFLEKMAQEVLHPNFDPLLVTGRTSSWGDLNAQNLPRSDKIRGCFIPAAGHLFIDADYRTLELATLSQACLRQFGLASKMAEVLNAGLDPHRIVAAHVANKAPEAVSKAERQQAKAINFGKPGGMGNETLRVYARESYGVDLSDEEVRQLSDAWFGSFPEMRTFLRDGEVDAGEAVAVALGLSAWSYFELTGSQKFLNYVGAGQTAESPHPVLGGMLLKVATAAAPATASGRPYDRRELAYFWGRLQARADLLPAEHQRSVGQCRPSRELRNAVVRAFAARGVFTLTGRLRANASYTARHNSVFQGLAADGAKLALWKLWRAGYRLVNFVHDEVVIELPLGEDVVRHSQCIRELMIAGMKSVVPDVRIDVELGVGPTWAKSDLAPVPAPEPAQAATIASPSVSDLSQEQGKDAVDGGLRNSPNTTVEQLQ